MGETKVVNLRSEPFDVYIGRGSGDRGVFGNRFEIGKDGDRAEVIRLFRVDFYQRLQFEPGFLEKVLGLEGKRLGCFCKPLPCHGDVYIEFLEARRKGEER